MFSKKYKDFKVDDRLKHIAFIMDGNGRWAKSHALPRNIGHKQGAKAFENTVRNCHSFGIKYVTVYAFSTENWSRPEKEVKALLELLDKYIDDAFVAGMPNIRIIHGKGTGALRAGVLEYLKKHRLIKSLRVGDYHEGGMGVTIAELNQ